MEFRGANKQFFFPKISLVYGKSDQHTTLYDSYNAKLATTFVGFIKLENSNNNYSISSKISFDLTNGNGKYFLYKQFVAWQCEGCSVAPLAEFANNEVYRELPRLDKIYNKKESDDRIYIDLRRGLCYTGELQKN